MQQPREISQHGTKSWPRPEGQCTWRGQGLFQHAEEKVHGFMEAALCNNDEDEEAVPQQGEDIGNEEGDGNPHVLDIKVRDAQQAEDYVTGTSVV